MSQVADTKLLTRRSVHAILLCVYLGTSVAIVLRSTPLTSANDRSRWSTVLSLVELGTYQINKIDKEPGWTTIDKVRHRRSESDGWRLYSTKPPLTPTLVAGLYYGLKTATGLSLYHNTEAVTRILLLLVNVVPMFIAMCLASRLIRRHVDDTGAGAAILAVACFATFLTPFLGTFNNHTIAATGVFFTLYFLSKILIEGSASGCHYAAAGGFAMWTCCNEFPAALFGVMVFAMLFRVDRRRTLLAFVPAAVALLAAFMVCNYAATGGWKPFYLYYGTDRYVYSINGVPSYWSQPRGLDANTESPLVYLFHCVLGHHGILSLTPVFVLSAVSLFTPKSWQHPFRPFLFPTAFLTLGVLGFYLTRTQNYNYGGTSAGLRWAFWLIPFWLLSLAPLVERWWPRRGRRAAIIGLLALSVASAGTAAGNPWSHPWLYRGLQSVGWIDYSDPPPRLDRPLRSWLFSAPSGETGRPITMTWASAGRPTRHMTLTMTPREDGLIELEANGNGFSAAECLLDPDAVEAGKPARDFLHSSGDPAAVDQLATFLTGTPGDVRFRPRRVRYISTPLRTDYFRTIQCSATIPHGDSGQRHRCDVWISDEVPCGAIKVQTSLTDAAGRPIWRRTWTLVQINGGTGENAE